MFRSFVVFGIAFGAFVSSSSTLSWAQYGDVSSQPQDMFSVETSLADQKVLPVINTAKEQSKGHFWTVTDLRSGVGQVQLSTPVPYPQAQFPNYAILQLQTDPLLQHWLESRLQVIAKLLEDRQIAFTDLRVEEQAVIVQISQAGLVSEAYAVMQTVDPSFQVQQHGNWFRLSLTAAADQNWFQYGIERFYQGVKQSASSSVDVSLLSDGRVMVSTVSADLLRQIVTSYQKIDKEITLRKINTSVRIATNAKDRQIVPVGTEILSAQQRSTLKIPVFKRQYLSNSDILMAESVYVDGEPKVQLYLSPLGKERLQELSADAKGAEQFALCRGGRVLRVGRFAETIRNGVLLLSGFRSIDHATRFAQLIQPNLLSEDFTVTDSSVANLFAKEE